MLCCLECRDVLDAYDSFLVCRKCDTRYPLSHQVPVLAIDGAYYCNIFGIDRTTFRELLDQIEVNGFLSAVNCFLAEACETRGCFFRNTFDLGRAAWKFALAVPDDAVALDLGCGTGVSSMALAPLCQQVIGCDRTLEYVEFLQRWAESERLANVRALCLGDNKFLPFKNETFDIVAINGNSFNCNTDALKEVRRVLRTSGQLYIGVDNRVGYDQLVNRRASPQLQKNVVLSEGSVTRQSLTRRLQQCGLSKVVFYSPFPNCRRFRQFAPLNGRTRITPPKSPKKWLSLIHQIACSPKVLWQFSPAFGVIASSYPIQSSLLQELIKRLKLSPVSGMSLAVSKTGTTIVRAKAHCNEEVIVRLPHSPSGRHKCETSVKRLRELHESHEIPDSFKRCLPIVLAETEYKGQLATAETILPGRSIDLIRNAPLDNTWRSLINLLLSWNSVWIERKSADAIHSRAKVLRAWVSSVIRVIPDSSDVEMLINFLRKTESELNQMPEFSVPAHGDCHPGNVLIDEKTGEVSGLIDWDVVIPFAPPLFDLLNFAVRSEFGGDPQEALLPLRIKASRQDDFADLVQRLNLPKEFLEYLQKYYILWRIADRLNESTLNPRRANRALQLLQWFYNTTEKNE